MIGSISNALGGMQGASRLLDASAARLAGGPAAGRDDALTAIVDTMSAKFAFEVNAAVLRTTLDMEKRVLDIVA